MKKLILIAVLPFCFLLPLSIFAQSKIDRKDRKISFSYSFMQPSLFNKVFDSFTKKEYQKEKLTKYHSAWELGYKLNDKHSISYSFSTLTENTTIGARLSGLIGEIFGFGGGVLKKYMIKDISQRFLYHYEIFPNRLFATGGVNLQILKISQYVNTVVDYEIKALDMKNIYIGPEVGLKFRAFTTPRNRLFLDVGVTYQYLGKLKIYETEPLLLGGIVDYYEIEQPNQLHGFRSAVMIGVKF